MMDKLLKILMYFAWALFAIAAKNAHAETFYGYYFWGEPGLYATKEEACQVDPLVPEGYTFQYAQGSQSPFQCKWHGEPLENGYIPNYNGYVYAGSCANGADHWYDNQCQDTPYSNCNDEGSPAGFLADIATAEAALDNGGIHDGSCSYTPIDANGDGKPDLLENGIGCQPINGSFKCEFAAISAGSYDSSDPQAPTVDTGGIEDEPVLDPFSDNLITSTTITESSVNNPDGSITDTVTETTDKTGGSYRSITTDQFGNIVVESGGEIVAVYTTVTETTTHPDGSVDQTITDSYTQDPVTISRTTLNTESLTFGSISTETPPKSGTQTVTQSIDSGGNTTGGSVTSNGDPIESPGGEEGTQIETGEVPTDVGLGVEIATSGEGYFNALQNAPLVAAISDLGQQFPSSGTCPPIEFDTAITGFVSSDFHCQLYTQIEPVLSLVMQAVWVLLGIVIIFGA